MNTEIIATSYLKEVIATTDLLSPFINEGDKEPSWDGNIYLYSNSSKKKTGIKKIPVQVKGTEKESHPEKITFRMDVDDIDNYLRDGGIILFVVYISKGGKRKKIYYECLLPMKIRVLKSLNSGKKKVPIECKPFPQDPEKMVSICMNFYQDMQKQRSFALAELKTVEELEKEGVLEGLSISVVAFGSQKDDVQSVFFQDTPYMYAKIKGSAILQPLEVAPQGIHISEEVRHSISVKGKVFYTSAQRIRSEGRVDFCIGNSFRIIGEGKKFSFNYTPTKNLHEALIDTEFMIAFIENCELQIGDVVLPVEKAKEKWEAKLPELKAQLEYCRKVKAVLDAFGLDSNVNIQETTDADVRNTDRFYKGIVKGEAVGNLKKDIPLVATMDYYGKKLVIAFCKINDSKEYNLYDFNTAPIWFAYNEDAEHYPTSRYDIIKADDFLLLANIDLKSLIESYQELSEHEHIYGHANMTLLNLLSAFDKSHDKRKDLLQCAYDLAMWLVGLDLPEEILAKSIRLINVWQTQKRMGTLTDHDLKAALQLAEDSSQEEVIRVGAYLVLGNQLAAEMHFDRVPEEQRSLLKDFPIFRYWQAAATST